MDDKGEGVCLSEQLSQVRLASSHDDWMIRTLSRDDDSSAAILRHSATDHRGAGVYPNDTGDRRMDLEGDGDMGQDFVGSQDFCTPDFITPIEQQFSLDFDGNKENFFVPRSPISLTLARSKRRRPDVGISMSIAMSASGDEVVLQPSSEVAVSGDQAERLSSAAKEFEELNVGYLPAISRARLSTIRKRVQTPHCIQNPFLPKQQDTVCAKEGRPRWEETSVSSYQKTGTGGSSSRYRDDFHEIKEVGRGCFSHVYKALNRIDGLLYAVKRTHRQLRQDSERKQALAEVQALAAIGSHPHIVRYHTAWFESDYLYIQMELCHCNLSEMKAAGDLSLEKTLVDVMWQITQALALIYSRGLVHLDIKPDNIYVLDGVFKLGDFGRATRLDGTIQIEEGDSRYTPLEILNDDYNHLHKADIFALGATMYELARGLPLPSSGLQFQALRQGKLAMLPGFSLPFQILLKDMMNPVASLRPSASDILNHSIFEH